MEGKRVSADIAREEVLKSHLVRIGKDAKAENRPATLKDLSGGGILVQTETGRKGILTAAHCLTGMYGTYWKEKNASILIRETPTKADIVDITVALSNTTLFEEGEEWEVPDIAWIELDQEKAGIMERYGMVFHRLGRNPTPREARQGEEGEPCVIETVAHGWFGEHEEATGGGVMLAQVEQVRNPDRNEIREREGWDFADHIFEDKESSRTQRMIESDEIPEWIKETRPPLQNAGRGGYSGGGIWRVTRDENTQETKYSLIGIIFAEMDPDPEGRRKLRGHREKSMGRILGVNPPNYMELPQPRS